MQLSFLTPLFDRRGPWATVYFDPAQNDESGAKRRELSVREACRTLEVEGADAATVRAVRDTLMDIGPAEDPSGRVVFAAAWGSRAQPSPLPAAAAAHRLAGPRCPG